MAKQSRPNRAKSIVAQPLFRCRQEKPKKGKGSYRREASWSHDSEASVFSGGWILAMSAVKRAGSCVRRFVIRPIPAGAHPA
jgi:alternative ribosome-rescue factor